jgi:hypothetical protein
MLYYLIIYPQSQRARVPEGFPLRKVGRGLFEGISSHAREEVEAMIMVGKPAPDFAVPAYHKGRFTHVRLSEHLGAWVLLFFYGGDYTFV